MFKCLYNMIQSAYNTNRLSNGLSAETVIKLRHNDTVSLYQDIFGPDYLK